MKLLKIARSYFRYLIAARWLDVEAYIMLFAMVSLPALVGPPIFGVILPLWLSVPLFVGCVLAWVVFIAGALLHHWERRL